jgi:hypothetical protein
MLTGKTYLWTLNILNSNN